MTQTFVSTVTGEDGEERGRVSLQCVKFSPEL